MSSSLGRRLSWAGIPILFVLHADWWLWDDPRMVFGLPAGLIYHALYCLVATLGMLLLVKYAWPAHLEVDEGGNDRP